MGPVPFVRMMLHGTLLSVQRVQNCYHTKELRLSCLLQSVNQIHRVNMGTLKVMCFA